MVVVKLEGVHYSTKKVRAADGKIKVYTYYFAWRGGPKLKGKPGSPEFIESYHDAHKTKRTLPRENINYLIELYTQSPKFNELRGKSRKEYLTYLEKIKDEFGKMPYSVLADQRTRRDFAQWHTNMAHKPRSANFALSVLQTLLNWGLDKGKIQKHHAGGIERHKEGSRADITWTEDQIALMDLLPPQIAHACRMALWTGQRQGDLIKLTWEHIHGDFIMLNQSKTNARVFVYIIPRLRQILDAIPQGESPYILNGAKGSKWESGFPGAWRKAFDRAGIEGVTFHDLRGTFENRLWQSGCTDAEAFSVTGRKMKGSAGSYFQRSKELSKTAMTKLQGTFGEQDYTKIYTKISALNTGGKPSA